jgi:hypothetical protein
MYKENYFTCIRKNRHAGYMYTVYALLQINAPSLAHTSVDPLSGGQVIANK